MDKIFKAVTVATKAHDGQKRKYSGLPYIIHPIDVASKVSDYTDDVDMIISAVLHDTLEDTTLTAEEIEEFFGKRVRELVVGLTNVSKAVEGANRKDRKRMDKARMAEQSQEVQIIKAFDIIANTSDIVKDDRDFAKIYIKEKIDFVEGMTKLPVDLKNTLKEHVTKCLEEVES